MKILFLSVPTGGGHHQAAKAMESYFAGRNDVECRMLDIAENVTVPWRKRFQKGTFFPPPLRRKFMGRCMTF